MCTYTIYENKKGYLKTSQNEINSDAKPNGKYRVYLLAYHVFQIQSMQGEEDLRFYMRP